MRRLMSEIQKGWDSAEKEGWLNVEAVEAMLRCCKKTAEKDGSESEKSDLLPFYIDVEKS